MARYLLIDNCSGALFGDTADLDGPARDEPPVDAARRLDEKIGVYGLAYVEVGRRSLASNESGYHVYTSDTAPLVENGQDWDAVAAILADPLTSYVTTIRRSQAGE